MLDPVSPEAAAKAAILNFLRKRNRLTSGSVVISELELRSAGRRADLVVADTHLTGIEIKTKADGLGRLEAQAKVYARVFPVAYAALASKHMRRAVPLIPDSMGILEIGGSDDEPSVVQRRRPIVSRQLDPQLQLSMAPVGALRDLLREHGRSNVSRCTRAELIEAASVISTARRVRFLRSYLAEKYKHTSSEWWREIGRRPITARDLVLLKAWPQRASRVGSEDPDVAFYRFLASRYGSQAFGPPPADVATPKLWPLDG